MSRRVASAATDRAWKVAARRASACAGLCVLAMLAEPVLAQPSADAAASDELAAEAPDAAVPDASAVSDASAVESEPGSAPQPGSVPMAALRAAPEGAPAASPAPLPPPPEQEPAPAAKPTKPSVNVEPELQARTRGEMLRNRYPRTSDTLVYQNQANVGFRVRGALSASYEPLTLRASIQGVGTYGDANVNSAQAATLGLHEGYLRAAGKPGSVTLGRQEISLGEQRFVGALDWAMGARSFDALRLQGSFGEATLDLFGAIVRMPHALDLDSGPVDSNGEQLCAAYFTLPLWPEFNVELYSLYRHDGPTEADPARHRNVVGLGTRLHGKRTTLLAYTLELTYQTGRVQTSASPMHVHRAAAAAVELTPSLTADGALALSMGGAFASGETANGTWNEVDNFYPTNHKFYGAADLVGLRNLREGHVLLVGRLLKERLKFTLGGYALALANPYGRWSDAGGATLGQSSTVTSTWLGPELDAIVRYEPLQQLFIEGGYALFIPDAGAADRGHGEPTHFAYLWIVSQVP